MNLTPHMAILILDYMNTASIDFITRLDGSRITRMDCEAAIEAA